MHQARLGTIMKIEPLGTPPMLQDNHGAMKDTKLLDLELMTKFTDMEVMAKLLDMEFMPEILGI